MGAAVLGHQFCKKQFEVEVEVEVHLFFKSSTSSQLQSVPPSHPVGMHMQNSSGCSLGDGKFLFSG
jgi:hypothetical protein